ncbi:MAG: ATP-dependent helicase [Anaerolineales bacterium]|jgi:DNA helicase-2/ATP-dependent DNA helicase PcrA|nr:ATP-dependent helicase [Anaerolineales bacterium]
MVTPTPFTLRPGQDFILNYTHGKMGISAVPGSGKTWTLARLAAELIRKGALEDDQEILIVTLVNSAVDNFYQRVSNFILERNLLPNIGYRVRTLHGLSHDIVRERPELAGLDNQFQILDEREADSILSDIVAAWLRGHPNHLDDYLKPDIDEYKQAQIRQRDLPHVLEGFGKSLIRYAKDRSWTAELLKGRIDQLPVALPLAEIGVQFYNDYQRALAYRGAVDFDDLIRLALFVLEQDDNLLQRLHHTWPFILEDEAQDSSLLQQEILAKLAGEDGNWVRVGDPNQAIFETFTTADPKWLRDYIQREDVWAESLPMSGRSSQSIITLANELVRWTMHEHPNSEAREALLAPPWIEPVPADDPAPNPQDDPSKVNLVLNKYTPPGEIHDVARSLARWLPEHPDQTVAVITALNEHASNLVDELKRKGIPYVDSLLKSTSSTRFSANLLGHILRYLSDPQSASKLSKVYLVWQRETAENPDTKTPIEQAAEILRKLRQVEDYIWPTPEVDWLASSGLEFSVPDIYAQFLAFRPLVQRWQSSVLLPIDQIVLAISQDLLTQPAELALAHKFSVLLRQVQQAHPSWRLPEMAGELMTIANNERRFIGFSEDDTGFDPEQHKGKVVVATIHKAKGLEWDRVHLMSVNNYDFPSGQAQDQFISEKWYVRDQLNLEAEALAQLKHLMDPDPYQWYEEGSASREARQAYIRERLRLLYVGITRAKRELILTWNTGKYKTEQQPAVPLVTLSYFWQKIQDQKRSHEIST